MKVLSLFGRSITAWRRDKASHWASSLAYYTIFSLPPLLIILFGVLGIVFDPEVVRSEVFLQMEHFIGVKGVSAVQILVDSAARSSHSFWATVLGVVTLAFAATGILLVLQDALNSMWHVEPKTGGLHHLIRKRLLSFGLILAIGFVLLVFLVLSAGVSFFMDVLIAQYAESAAILPIVSELLSILLIALLFALLFKYLPDISISWRDVWVGALLTAVMFTIGKFVIGWYLGRTDLASTYGAAGSMIVLLLWIYFSAQVFFLGAEFTKIYAETYGWHNVRPGKYAHFVHKHHVDLQFNLNVFQKASVVAKVLLWQMELLHLLKSMRRFLGFKK